MKGLASLALGLLALAGFAAASPVQVSANAEFATVDGVKFKVDGQSKYLAGTNSYWISFLTKNADVDLVLDHLVKSGLKVLRIWGFNDVTRKPGAGTVYFQYLASSGSQINTGADGLQRLDYIAASAEKRGIKLIINFVNHWGDYGGMPAYVTAFGGTKETWFTNSKAQTQYRAYVKAVVSRLANSSAVFAWELANEPRCKGCNTDVIFNWATDVSKYIKSLDPNHMVTLGDEGFGLPGGDSSTNYPYGTSEGVDFVKNLAIPTLDFGTFHMYPQSWSVPNSFGPGWVKDHAAACVKAGKPCMFEEYGTGTDHCNVEKPWQAASRNTEGIASDLFWQWGDTLSSGRSNSDGNTIWYGSTDAQCLITDHVKAIGSLGRF